MPIPVISVTPQTTSPSTFSADMDTWLSEQVAWTAAVNEASNLYGASLLSTSATSLTIGIGSKSLTAQAGASYGPGMEVLIAYTTTPTNRMVGTVTSYNSSTGALVVNVTAIGGSGTYGAWSISATSVANFDGQTFTNLVLAGEITETPYTLTGSDINPANGTIQSKTLTGTWTATSSLTSGQSVLLHVTKGANSIVWPTMVWVYGAPTLSSSVVSVVILWNVGGTLYGCYAGPAS